MSEDEEDVTALWRFGAEENEGSTSLLGRGESEQGNDSGESAKRARASGKRGRGKNDRTKKVRKPQQKRVVQVPQPDGVPNPVAQAQNLQGFPKYNENVAQSYSVPVDGGSGSHAILPNAACDMHMNGGGLYVLKGSISTNIAHEVQCLMGKEIRVSAKRGICAALLRPPTRLVPTGDGTDFDGVLNTGVVLWSTKVMMERFQILVRMMYRFSTDVQSTQNRRVLRFQPSYDVISSNVGFSEARVTFSTAVDLFRFLGVTRTEDMKTLLWRVWKGPGLDGNHLRVLGACQLSSTCAGSGSGAALKLFLGHSCSTRPRAMNDPVTGALEGDIGTVNDGLKERSVSESAPCLVYPDIKWDAENNCFAHEPILAEHENEYHDSAMEDCSCFQITWEVERCTSQRTLSHIAMDTEGIRSGKMEIEMPYFLVGPQVQESLVNLVDEHVLNNIISRLSH